MSKARVILGIGERHRKVHGEDVGCKSWTTIYILGTGTAEVLYVEPLPRSSLADPVIAQHRSRMNPPERPICGQKPEGA